MKRSHLSNYINIANTNGDRYPLFSYVSNFIKEFKGVYLAGGALRRMISGESGESDWDFFFKDNEVYSLFKDALLTSPRFSVISSEEREKNLTLKMVLNDLNVTIECQLIHFEFYQDIPYLLSTFDYTICQFGTDGFDLHFGDSSLDDLRDKKLVVCNITYPISSMRRLLKYSKNKFWIDGPEIARLILLCREVQLESKNEWRIGSGPSSA